MAQLTFDQQRSILDSVQDYADEHEGDFWGMKQLSTYVREMTGMKPDNRTLKEYLKRAGYKLQRERWIKE